MTLFDRRCRRPVGVAVSCAIFGLALVGIRFSAPVDETATVEQYAASPALEREEASATLLFAGDLKGALRAEKEPWVAPFEPKTEYENAGAACAVQSPEPHAKVRSADGMSVSPEAEKRRTGGQLTQNEIVELQRLLNDRGFDVGVADGIAGPKTRTGIEAFQKLAGIEANGELSWGLLRKLRNHGKIEAGVNAKSDALSVQEAIPKQTAEDHPQLIRHKRARCLVRIPGDGEKAAANPAVTTLLRGARAKLQHSKLVPVLDSDFFGSHVMRKPWQITGAGFEPQWRLGMRTDRADSLLYQTLQAFWATLADVVGVSDRSAGWTALYAQRPFGGAFELRVGFRVTGRRGRLQIGPYLDSSRRDGYRFDYSPQDEHGISVVWSEGGREQLLAHPVRPLRLNDGVLHELVWSRTADGTLKGAVDLREAFSVIDPHPDLVFKGLIIRAQDGGFSIAYVKLLAERPSPAADHPPLMRTRLAE